MVGTPLPVRLLQGRTDLHALLPQAVQQIAPIGGDHITAAAVAHGEIVHGAPAKHRHGVRWPKGQRLSVIL